MKTTHILMTLFAGAIVLTSCGKKENPKQKADVAAFETAWNETGATATAWSADLKAAIEVCQKEADDAKVMDMSKMKKEDKAMADSGIAICAEQLEKFKAMWKDYEGFSAQWEADSKAWGDWKANWTRGAMKDEEVDAALTQWNAKLAEHKAKLDSWSMAFNDVKTACNANREKMMLMKEKMNGTPAKM